MRRRSVLVSVGVLVAGCTGPGGSGTTTRETTTTTTDSTGGETTTTTAGQTTTSGGGEPAIVESSLSVTGVECASQDASGAEVSFGDDRVRVDGSVVGNDGCYRARLEGVTYDASSDTCRVVVEAFDAGDPDEACMDCITAVGYEASVVFDGGLPGTVEVVHDDLGGRSTVATASR